MPKQNLCSYVLLVEGEADKKLIKRLCKQQNINLIEIEPVTPEDLLTDEDILSGATGNGKTGVLNRLNYLIPDLEDDGKPLKCLAIIVDADQSQDGQGYQATFDKVSQLLQSHDYNFDQTATQQAQGIVFSHNNGLEPIGVWIMPSNQEDGALESWISACINNTELPLFNHATTVVNQLSTSFNRTFTGNKKAKAEIATWLAWQKSPSIGLYAAVPLLDIQTIRHQQLITWLRYIFPHPVTT